jgi:hypothetical protein
LEHQEKLKGITKDYIAEDLKDAVQWIFQFISMDKQGDKTVGNLSGYT